MFKCECELIGVADLMFGAYVSEPKQDDETHHQYDHRTWRKKVHVGDDGQAYIVPFALKNCLESSARWLSLKIAGEGKKTFTKRFMSGLLATERLLLTKINGDPVTIDDIDPIELFVPSSGKRGQGARVPRIFPTVREWRTVAQLMVFDNKITPAVLEKHFVAAGKFIGVGSMRVENGGINGRFEVRDFVMETIEA